MKEEYIDIRKWRELLAKAKWQCRVEKRRLEKQLKALSEEKARLEAELEQ